MSEDIFETDPLKNVVGGRATFERALAAAGIDMDRLPEPKVLETAASIVREGEGPRLAYFSEDMRARAVTGTKPFFLLTGAELRELRRIAPALELGKAVQLGGKKGLWWAMPGPRETQALRLWVNDVRGHLLAIRQVLGATKRPPVAVGKPPPEREYSRDPDGYRPIFFVLSGQPALAESVTPREDSDNANLQEAYAAISTFLEMGDG